MEPLLELSHVSYAYHSKKGETFALSDISFQVHRGEFIAVVGPSGCGKSTLLSLISGLLLPESGSILFEGQKDTKFRDKIGYMLQKDHLFEWRTIYKNVILGLEIQNKLDEKSKERVEKMIFDYGLSRFRDARPSELSGGMRQRAALVRTLVLKPELLLLDEPFSALDYQTRLSVGNDIGMIIRSEKKTAVLVTHDLAEAVSLADRIVILSKRPASIKRILTIEMPRELSPMERRNHDTFKTYFNMIWKEMHDETDTD